MESKRGGAEVAEGFAEVDVWLLCRVGDAAEKQDAAGFIVLDGE